MIGIIDYGMGNLRSVENALKHLDLSCVISEDQDVLSSCDHLILPGVGSFNDCMTSLENRNLKEFTKAEVEKGKPLLGICLGMQMLFEESEENGVHAGFGFLKGRVVLMEDPDVRIPEIGWNELEWQNHLSLMDLYETNPYVYYVHSYYAQGYEDSDLYGYSTYGSLKVPGLVKHGNVMGTQFHPEKSGEEGLKMLKWFAEVM